MKEINGDNKSWVHTRHGALESTFTSRLGAAAVKQVILRATWPARAAAAGDADSMSEHSHVARAAWPVG
jgi:hypothetical protein